MAEPETVIIFAKRDDFDLLGETGRGTALPVEELRKNLESFTKALQSLLPAVQDAGGGLGLKELEVAVGIDGKCANQDRVGAGLPACISAKRPPAGVLRCLRAGSGRPGDRPSACVRSKTPNPLNNSVV